MVFFLTGNLDSLKPLLRRDAEIRQRLLLERLLLGLHDVGQARVPGLVEAQVGRDDHGQLGLERLDTAVHLPRHLHAVAGELDLASLGSLRPAKKTSQHLARLAGVVVDALLAEDNEVALVLVDSGLEQLGDAQGLEVLALLGLDVDGAVGAHGHGGAQDVLSLGRTRADDADILDGGLLALTNAHTLFDRELVERVHAVLDAGGLDARLGLVDSGLDL